MAKILTSMIRGYRYLLSPFLAPSCRYQPTCSKYALDALNEHGAIKGGYLAIRRVFRCHPWGGSGYDPVPALQKGKKKKAVIAKESCNH